MLLRYVQYPLLGLFIFYLSIFANLGYTAHSNPTHSHKLIRRARTLAQGYDNIYENDFNSHAHLYEKLYLWEAYNILIQATQTVVKQKVIPADPAKQNLILPFNNQRGQDEKSNQHLVNGKRTGQALTYKEFMLRLKGVDADKAGIPDITEPTSVDDLERAERQLWDAKVFSGILPMQQVSPNIQTKNSNSNSGRAGKKGGGKAGSSSGGKAKALKEQNNIHVKFLKTVGNTVREIHLDSSKKNLGRIPEQHERAMEIARRMAKLRGASTQGFLIKELSKVPTTDDPDYWGLSRASESTEGKRSTTIVMDDTADCQVPGMEEYQSIRFPETYNANAEKIRGKRLQNGDDFENWAKNLGNPKKTTSGPADTDANVSHWKEEELWKNIAAGKHCAP